LVSANNAIHDFVGNPRERTQSASPEFLLFRKILRSLVREEPLITAGRRETDVVRLLALHRFLTRPQLEEFLFAESTLTPRSRQVVTWRLLGRLQRHGLVAATPRQTGGAVAGSTMPGYFLTTAGLRLASTFYPDLPARRPARRAPFLLAHSVTAADVELAFRRATRGNPGHELELWECDWQTAMKLGSKTLLPDARLVYRLGRVLIDAFVEVDLGTEGTRFFARKVDRYVTARHDGDWRTQLPRWPLTLTITPTAARAASLWDATTARLEAHPYSSGGMVFKFCAIDALLGESGVLGARWRVAGKKESSLFATPEQLAAAVDA